MTSLGGAYFEAGRGSLQVFSCAVGASRRQGAAASSQPEPGWERAVAVAVRADRCPPPSTDGGVDGGSDGSSLGDALDGGTLVVDPAVSAAWQWTPCGTLPPTTAASVKAMAYAPLTEQVAAAYSDGRVIIHSVDPATADRVLREATPAATALAFSPDGKVLAEARGAAVSLRRVQDGQVLATTDAAAGACAAPMPVALLPGWQAGCSDGARMPSASGGPTRRRWWQPWQRRSPRPR